MLITRLELEDWKSYRRATIPFREGTNAIVGPNGTGKSSIIEAIGFALFGYRSASLAQCLREGAESGRVVVTLVSSFDEREYEVERGFTSKTTTRYRVLDTDMGRTTVAEGNEDVQAWLRQHLRVAPTAALDALFENAVGVPQGTYTAPFQQPPAARKAIFNPLLQVEEYATAADRLLDSQRLLSERITGLNEEIARAEGLLARLPALEAEAEELAGDLEGLAERVTGLEGDLETVRAALEGLDAAEQRAREANTSAERARAEANTQARLLEAARLALHEAEDAAERLRQSADGHRAYQEAERVLQGLETRRSERDELVAQGQALQAELARLSERRSLLDRSLEQVAASAERLAALAPLAARQAELEAALQAATARAQQAELAAAQRLAAEQEVASAERDLRDGEAGLGRAQEATRRLASLRERLERTIERGQQANVERAAAEAEIPRLQEQVAALTATTSARCPVCESDLSAARRQELLERNHLEIAALQERIRTLSEQREAARHEYVSLHGQVQRAEAALRNLPGEAEVARLRDVLAARRARATEAAAQAAALHGADDAIAAIGEQLRTLGDPRREYQRHEDRVAQRAGLEEEQAALRTRQSAAEERRASLEEALSAFASLDKDLSAARAARARHEEAHGLYLANRQLAGQADGRRAHVTSLEESLAACRAAAAAAEEEQTAALAGYDAAEHSRLRGEASMLLAGLASARTEQEQKAARHRAVSEEVAGLRGVSAQLDGLRAAHAEQGKLLEVVRLVRELLRQAGPYVTQRLVRYISREASRLYGDIMDDHAGQLNWSDDYEVTFEVRGRQRAFRQMSGGEQMAAALAVRLAALRETSAIDIALFDEPTAHLDTERRDSLADSILQVKGFSQLFVISHDDTFERSAQNFIRITKDEQGSRLVGPEGG
ncbi:MAG: SMC family ATPase [Chloroflexi bacterium]|nr:SMC family ATPase [Chloroflexota bacterium]